MPIVKPIETIQEDITKLKKDILEIKDLLEYIKKGEIENNKHNRRASR